MRTKVVQVYFKLRAAGPQMILQSGLRRLGTCAFLAVGMAQALFGMATVARTALTGLTLMPGRRTRVFFAGVAKGHNQLQIHHRDQSLLDRPEALTATISPATSVRNAGPTGRTLALGGGGFDGFRVTSSADVQFEWGYRCVAVDLLLRADAPLRIDQLRLGRAEADVSSSAARRLVRKYVNLADARFILYADIHMGIVDGSSIWLASMATMLAGLGTTVLIAKRAPATDIVVSNIGHRENLIIVAPSDADPRLEELSVEQATSLISELDALLPRVRNVVVRGCRAAAQLQATRQFRERSAVYLTDFYRISEKGVEIHSPADAALAVIQAGVVLVQTPAIEQQLRALTGAAFRAVELPPPIPDDLPTKPPARPVNRPIRIGYAGKIAPMWGVNTLLDWVRQVRKSGLDIELHLAANKIAGGSSPEAVRFVDEIRQAIRDAKAVHYTDLNRERAIAMMADMDFVWCWRPPELENHTLEVSTKLVEMGAIGARSICFPSAVNRDLLGEAYPFFVRDRAEFRSVLEAGQDAPTGLAQALRDKHSMSRQRERLAAAALNRAAGSSRRICFAGHDFKFVDPYYSRLKAQGHQVLRDTWGWGDAVDEDWSAQCAEWADIVFCEWGLANAVWHSHNKRSGARLFVRMHLQEVGPRASRLAGRIRIASVNKVICVSRTVRDQAMELFGWPADKLVVVPNFVLTDEYALTERSFDGSVRLGMVGMTPQRKRFDRAVDTLVELRRRGRDAELRIKGPRPETMEFMHGKSRAAELRYYEEQYERIERDPLLAGRVHFDPWGNDVALWYRGIDHILSCSDFESFHYSLADGVLSGCQPLVWPWQEADTLYTPGWLVQDAASAADRIEEFREMAHDARAELMRANRRLVEDRYGHIGVYRRLSDVIGLADT